MKGKKAYQVDTGGLRGELPLTDSQKEQILEYIKINKRWDVPYKRLGFPQATGTQETPSSSYWFYI